MVLAIGAGIVLSMALDRPAGRAGPGAQPPGPAASLADARGLIDQGRFAESELLARRLLAETEAEHGASSAEIGDVLDVLVAALWRSGKSKEPETLSLAERAVEAKEKALGRNDVALAPSLTNLGIVLQECGEFAAAKPAYERAVALQEAALGPRHPSLAPSLTYLGMLLYVTDRYADARPVLERAVAVQEAVVDPDNLDLALSLQALANLLYLEGDYAGAKPLFERALAIRERRLGPDHPLVSGSLNNLANLLNATGDYAGARASYERALRIREKVLGPEHPLVATSLNNLGYVLRETGDYAAARPHYERALAIVQRSNGMDHPNTARALDNLAELLGLMHEYVRARQLLTRAIAIQEEKLGPTHSGLAGTLMDLASVMEGVGEVEAARPLVERALRIRRAARGPDHPDVAKTLVHLAEVQQASGEMGPARSCYESALVIQKKALGERHPEVARTMGNFAVLLAETDRNSDAFELALEAEQIGMEHERLTARTLAEREALRYEAVRASGLGLALDLAVRHPGVAPKSTERAWDAVIRSRALVLDEIASRHRTVESLRDPQIARLVQQLVAARSRLANLTVRGPGNDAEGYRQLLEDARQEKERAERALAAKSAWFRGEQAKGRIVLADVAASLPAGTALVAYVQCAPPEREARRGPQAPVRTAGGGDSAIARSRRSYIAFVLPPGGHPSVLRLGDADEIDGVVARWSREASRGLFVAGRSAADAETAYRAVGDELRSRIWDPLTPRLARAKCIFVVPDGALDLVNLSALPARAGRYLIESTAPIHYLSAERDIAEHARSSQAGRGLLAMGGPDFDGDSRSADMGSGVPQAKRRHDGTQAAVRGALSPCADYQSMWFRPLPAAAREAEEIAALWRNATGAGSRRMRERQDVECLVGAEASEAAFKERAPGKRILHLATHGFVLGDSCSRAVQGARGIASMRSRVDGSLHMLGSENPLLLSGLAFAGANRRDSTLENGEDGILTAEEIASLNLDGVEWVVLSACDTGLGKVLAGEGVFGLRRAFEVAGARTLIMSLWSVRDELAREWMQSLYRNRLQEHIGTAGSVRLASLRMLQERRARGLDTHPFYWASFIAAGGWE